MFLVLILPAGLIAGVFVLVNAHHGYRLHGAGVAWPVSRSAEAAVLLWACVRHVPGTLSLPRPPMAPPAGPGCLHVGQRRAEQREEVKLGPSVLLKGIPREAQGPAFYFFLT